MCGLFLRHKTPSYDKSQNDPLLFLPKPDIIGGRVLGIFLFSIMFFSVHSTNSASWSEWSQEPTFIYKFLTARQSRRYNYNIGRTALLLLLRTTIMFSSHSSTSNPASWSERSRRYYCNIGKSALLLLLLLLRTTYGTIHDPTTPVASDKKVRLCLFFSFSVLMPLL